VERDRRPIANRDARRIAEGKAVPASSEEDELTGSRAVVLVVRLVLDRQARLRSGELLDAGAKGQGRFVTLAEMGEAVMRWLERQRENGSGDVDRAT
jgi:hypothetical protein